MFSQSPNPPSSHSRNPSAIVPQTYRATISSPATPLEAIHARGRPRKSFSSSTYTNRGGGGGASHSPLLTSHFLLSPVCPAVTTTLVRNSFRPSTCKITRPQVLCAQQLHKTGGGGYLFNRIPSNFAHGMPVYQPEFLRRLSHRAQRLNCSTLDEGT
jgi:hypothetical protein